MAAPVRLAHRNGIPNLDRMAAEGIRFNNLFAGSCVCAPTRCTFLTGKHSGNSFATAAEFGILGE